MLHPPGAGLDAGADAGLVHASSLANELARLDQALADLTACEDSEVALVCCASAAEEAEFAAAISQRARRQAFATATLSLADGSLTALDRVVRAAVEALTVPGRGVAPGLAGALRAYAARHSADAPRRFARAAERHGASGDLTAWCGAFLAAERPEEVEAELSAWLTGTELGRSAPLAEVRGALTERTARRALVELTRVVRCLGHAGLLLSLTNGGRVARGTERQRERAYTLLRELIDNFDGGRGMSSTRLVITGGAGLFTGPRSLRSLPALASRLGTPSDGEPPPPHRSAVRLEPGSCAAPRRRTSPVPPAARRELRALIRIAQGLPPIDAVTTMSVGHERVDAVVAELLAHARIAGSVFTVLRGEYGSGKTHLLLHLSARARAAGHPVFRLNLERLNLDLGNPARHLHRMLADSELPGPRRLSALEWLSRLLRTAAGVSDLTAAIETVAAARGEAAGVARRALRAARSATAPARGLEAYLAARDLEGKAGAPAQRREAYGRLLLWLELLSQLERWQGPVLLIDEAENLYVSGLSRALRRTALRSLAFYCGGALPSTCVVLTSTPRALARLKYEAGELLADVDAQEGSLEWENAAMLRHRLLRLTPMEVPSLGAEHRAELVARVVATHARVRGDAVALDTARWLGSNEPPRVLVRRLIDELEVAWWRERQSPETQAQPTAHLDCTPAVPRWSGEPAPTAEGATQDRTA